MKKTILILSITVSLIFCASLYAAPADKQQQKKPAKADPEKIEAEKKKKVDAEFEKKSSDEHKAKWIEDTLNYGMNNERREAINRINLIKDESIKKRLFVKLIEVIKSETESEIVVKALTVAGDLKVNDAAQAISARLDDSSDEVKIAAAYALKKIDAKSSKEKLIEKLKAQDMTKDSNFNDSLISTLGQFKAVELSKFAIEKIDDNKTTQTNRELLVMFLGNSGAADGKELLIKIYKNEDENLTVRSYAVNSLSKLHAKEAAKDINEVIKQIEGYPFKKKQAYFQLFMYSVTALVRLGDDTAYPKVINALKSNNPAVRLQAIKLLNDLNDKRSIDILKYKMKYDPSKKVRKAARNTLKEFGVDLKSDEETDSGEDDA